MVKIEEDTIADSLDSKGYAHMKGVLSEEECAALQNMYAQPHTFRSIINMQRYRFGKGEYKYFQYPLPDLLTELRESFYTKLYPIANTWMQKLNIAVSYPPTHREFLEQCHRANQTRPTPLILRYEQGGFNTLHQDLYGEVYFPFQIVFVLTKEHTGGELVLVEQLPRAQSKAEVLKPDQGDAIVFTTNFRPVNGTRGYYRAKMKHGVSEVKAGVRMALGIIFHDAA